LTNKKLSYIADKLRDSLCKCNDVADLTSVIKICLKNLITHIRPFKVIGTDTNRPAIYDFLLVLSSNFDLEIRVRGLSRSLDMSPLIERM